MLQPLRRLLVRQRHDLATGLGRARSPRRRRNLVTLQLRPVRQLFRRRHLLVFLQIATAGGRLRGRWRTGRRRRNARILRRCRGHRCRHNDRQRNPCARKRLSTKPPCWPSCRAAAHRTRIMAAIWKIMHGIPFHCMCQGNTTAAARFRIPSAAARHKRQDGTSTLAALRKNAAITGNKIRHPPAPQHGTPPETRSRKNFVRSATL